VVALIGVAAFAEDLVEALPVGLALVDIVGNQPGSGMVAVEAQQRVFVIGDQQGVISRFELRWRVDDLQGRRIDT
jgi:hypothetical protein